MGKKLRIISIMKNAVFTTPYFADMCTKKFQFVSLDKRHRQACALTQLFLNQMKAGREINQEPILSIPKPIPSPKKSHSRKQGLLVSLNISLDIIFIW